jgi:hypothetical protein
MDAAGNALIASSASSSASATARVARTQNRIQNQVLDSLAGSKLEDLLFFEWFRSTLFFGNKFQDMEQVAACAASVVSTTKPPRDYLTARDFLIGTLSNFPPDESIAELSEHVNSVLAIPAAKNALLEWKKTFDLVLSNVRNKGHVFAYYVLGGLIPCVRAAGVRLNSCGSYLQQGDTI